MGSLEDNQNVTERIRTEFDALLRSKDVTIQELQKKLAQANQQKEEFASKINDMQTMLVDKDSLNKTLTDSCNDLKEKIEHMKECTTQMVQLEKEFRILQQTHEKTMIEQSQLKKQIQQMKTAHEKTVSELQKHETEALKHLKEQTELRLEKEVLDKEKRHHDEIQRLKVQKQEEIDKYQEKYFDLLEQIKQAQSVSSSQASETDSAEKN